MREREEVKSDTEDERERERARELLLNIPNRQLIIGEHSSPGVRMKGEETRPVFFPHVSKGACQKGSTNLGEFPNREEN